MATISPSTTRVLHKSFLFLLLFNQIFSLISSPLLVAATASKTKQPVSKKSSPRKAFLQSHPSAANDPLAFEPYGKNIFDIVGGGLRAESGAGFSFNEHNNEADTSEVDPSSLARCFCPTAAVVDDCSCTVESVDRFNHHELQPILSQLLIKPFFRYYKININRECPFWTDHSQCTMRDCGLASCSSDELPPSFRWTNTNKDEEQTEAEVLHAALEQAKSGSEPETCKDIRDLGAVDANIGVQERQDMAGWALHSESSAAEFCEAEDESCPDAEYINLLKNPERYTGYRGESAWKVWRTIYRENCFEFRDGTSDNNNAKKPSSKHAWPADLGKRLLRDMCMEKRTFYRLISGIHSSINIHLSANYLFQTEPVAQFKPNLKEFQRRFDAELTHGQGPLWLTNLYFAYLVELRALQKAAPLLRAYSFYTGISDEDVQVKQLMDKLLEVIDTFNAHFDESLLFNGISRLGDNDDSDNASRLNNNTSNNSMPTTLLSNADVHARDNKNAAERHAQLLFDEFRNHFQNVSRIMDCVGCDKCRLWGKLQIQGLGTALRILFNDLMLTKSIHKQQGAAGSPPPLQLRRNEIIALVNGFGRLSSSIQQLWTFRAMVDLGGKSSVSVVKETVVAGNDGKNNATTFVQVNSTDNTEESVFAGDKSEKNYFYSVCEMLGWLAFGVLVILCCVFLKKLV